MKKVHNVERKKEGRKNYRKLKNLLKGNVEESKKNTLKTYKAI